jgi:hypothetical protein
MKNHQLKLIDSTYSVDEAKEVVQSLLNDKIKFLNQRIFSLQERFGSDTSAQEKRVRELKAELRQLIETLRPFENEDFQVEIDCLVKMKIKKLETFSAV